MTKLTEFQKTNQIPKEIKKYFNDKGIEDGGGVLLSRLANIGEAYVSQIINGKTHIGKTIINDKYYISICKAIGFSINVELWTHFETFNYQTIVTKINENRADKQMFTIDGDTGAGKSHALEKYKTDNPEDTYLVKCSAVENAKEFAKRIAEELKLETTGTVGAILKRVVEKLQNKSNAILLIDEAEHIGNKPGYINILKSLEDGLRKKSTIGIIGMGINTILENGYEKSKPNFRQTARRFSNRETLEKDISDDVHKICEDLNINNDKVKDWFAFRVRNLGEFEVYIHKAFKEADKSGEKITVTFLNTLDF
jgi:DNA transposition AAA+ family ATPase